MAHGISSGFKWKLTRETAWDVWELQFQAYLSTKGSLWWLTEAPLPDMPEQIVSEATAKAQIILAMKDASLIRLSVSAPNAKAYWDALVLDFQGRIRIRKHGMVREREVSQKKSETFVAYCDRAAELQARMTTAGISAGSLVDNVILGLAQPLQRNNSEQLTRLAYHSGENKAMQEVLSHI